MNSRYQEGYIYEKSGAFHVQCYATDLLDGRVVKKRRSHLPQG